MMSREWARRYPKRIVYIRGELEVSVPLLCPPDPP